MIRFTPRRPGSHWSAKNLSRMPQLREAGLVQESGVRVYEARSRKREKLAAYEQADVALPAEYEDRIRSNPAAWSYFQAARPSYRKQVSWWIASAKKEETRLRRLSVLIDSCAAGELIPAMRWTEKKR